MGTDSKGRQSGGFGGVCACGGVVWMWTSRSDVAEAVGWGGDWWCCMRGWNQTALNATHFSVLTISNDRESFTDFTDACARMPPVCSHHTGLLEPPAGGIQSHTLAARSPSLTGQQRGHRALGADRSLRASEDLANRKRLVRGLEVCSPAWSSWR